MRTRPRVTGYSPRRPLNWHFLAASNWRVRSHLIVVLSRVDWRADALSPLAVRISCLCIENNLALFVLSMWRSLTLSLSLSLYQSLPSPFSISLSVAPLSLSLYHSLSPSPFLYITLSIPLSLYHSLSHSPFLYISLSPLNLHFHITLSLLSLSLSPYHSLLFLPLSVARSSIDNFKEGDVIE